MASDPTIPPVRRLRAWLHAVLELKQAKVRDDPKLFAAYGILAEAHSQLATNHVVARVRSTGRLPCHGPQPSVNQTPNAPAPHHTNCRACTPSGRASII
ncbi:hypothetical protein [Kribbella sp. NPDC048915]|uniref:hypothetical protein n=1 Tax=Kribbella sp. NPDC048915 TaxID=3155148 RepID=UPI0033D9824E